MPCVGLAVGLQAEPGLGEQAGAADREPAGRRHPLGELDRGGRGSSRWTTATTSPRCSATRAAPPSAAVTDMTSDRRDVDGVGRGGDETQHGERRSTPRVRAAVTTARRSAARRAGRRRGRCAPAAGRRPLPLPEQDEGRDDGGPLDGAPVGLVEVRGAADHELAQRQVDGGDGDDPAVTRRG